MAVTFTMKRTGSFHVKTAGPNHCGVADEFDIQYSFVCRCGTTLTKQGFLFDQLTIKKYFDAASKKVVTLSCEEYAVRCARDLFKLIVKENPKCKILGMTLTLSPMPEASMTVEWDGNPDQKVAGKDLAQG